MSKSSTPLPLPMTRPTYSLGKATKRLTRSSGQKSGDHNFTSQPKTLKLKKKLVIAIIEHMSKKWSINIFKAHGTIHPLSFPAFRPAWSKSRVPDLGSISRFHARGDPSLQTWPMPAGDGELPGAWMALAICSTVGPLMSHLLFPWESTSWPRDFWSDSVWVLEGHACYVEEWTQVHFALGHVPNLFQSGTSV